MQLSFVNLGNNFPKYLKLNLMRLRQNLPSLDISLTVSRGTKFKGIPDGVKLYEYHRDIETDNGLASLELSPSFRNGYWHYTFERLIALEVAHRSDPKRPLLHVESDVLLLPNFPFEELSNKRCLMWGRYSRDEDIAAILYSPSLVQTLRLTSYLRDELQKDAKTSDMRALKAISSRLTDTEFQYFPSMFRDEALSDGLFDSASLGIWLGGNDPTNAFGFRTFHQIPGHIENEVKDYVFTFANGILSVSKGSEERKVFCLHIHSKDQLIFGKEWEKTLSEWVTLSGSAQIFKKFQFASFIKWGLELIRDLFSIRAMKGAWGRVSKCLKL
jgi:hypothetical protein